MQELIESDYKVFATPGSFQWDAFKYGNELRRKIFAERMEPYEEEYKEIGNTRAVACDHSKCIAGPKLMFAKHS